LHDAVSQRLFGVVLEAEAAATLLVREPNAAQERVLRLQRLAQEALEELRTLVFELRPPELERDGLCGALRKRVELLPWQERERVELELDDGVSAGRERDVEVLRIAQEALQNALRHAAAARVAIRLRCEGDGLVLEVEDDGVGFDPRAPELRSQRLGLTSMEERARRVGGGISIRSRPGGGTLVRLEL
jgi:signal transduction histidine kinase